MLFLTTSRKLSIWLERIHNALQTLLSFDTLCNVWNTFSHNETLPDDVEALPEGCSKPFLTGVRLLIVWDPPWHVWNLYLIVWDSSWQAWDFLMYLWPPWYLRLFLFVPDSYWPIWNSSWLLWNCSWFVWDNLWGLQTFSLYLWPFLTCSRLFLTALRLLLMHLRLFLILPIYLEPLETYFKLCLTNVRPFLPNFRLLPCLSLLLPC